jgi:hypothetical protein
MFQGLENAPQTIPVQVGFNSNYTNQSLYNPPLSLTAMPQNSSTFMMQQQQLNFQQFQQFQLFQQSQTGMQNGTMSAQHSDITAVSVAQQHQEPQPLEQKPNL